MDIVSSRQLQQRNNKERAGSQSPAARQLQDSDEGRLTSQISALASVVRRVENSLAVLRKEVVDELSRLRDTQNKIIGSLDELARGRRGRRNSSVGRGRTRSDRDGAGSNSESDTEGRRSGGRKTLVGRVVPRPKQTPKNRYFPLREEFNKGVALYNARASQESQIEYLTEDVLEDAKRLAKSMYDLNDKVFCNSDGVEMRDTEIEKTPSSQGMLYDILRAIENRAPCLKYSKEQWAARYLLFERHKNRRDHRSRARRVAASRLPGEAEGDGETRDLPTRGGSGLPARGRSGLPSRGGGDGDGERNGLPASGGSELGGRGDDGYGETSGGSSGDEITAERSAGSKGKSQGGRSSRAQRNERSDTEESAGDGQVARQWRATPRKRKSGPVEKQKRLRRSPRSAG